MKRKKAILLSISGVLIICIICLIGAALLTNQMDKQSYYVYCELLKPGISLSEAEKRLSSFGFYSISEGPHIYYVSFTDLFNTISVGNMRLMFDENDRLIGAARNTSLSDWSEQVCQ